MGNNIIRDNRVGIYHHLKVLSPRVLAWLNVKMTKFTMFSILFKMTKNSCWKINSGLEEKFVVFFNVVYKM